MIGKTYRILFVAALWSITGCGNSTTPCPPLPDAKGPYTISGHLKFKTPMTLPSDAHVICYWGGVSDPGHATFDGTHVFGEATLDVADNSFSITFHGVPPNPQTVTQNPCKTVEAAPAGYVLLVSKPVSGVPTTWFDTVRVLGAIDRTAMVYILTNTQLHGWLGAFPEGYGVGASMDTLNRADSLSPVSNSGLELLIDSTEADFHLPIDWLDGSTMIDRIY